MENSSIDGGIESDNSQSKLPLILAIAACALGALAFLFSWTTKNNLNRHKDTIIKEVNEAVDAAKQAAADAHNAGAGVESTATLKNDFEQFKLQIIAKYDELARSQELVVKNQTEINNRLVGNKTTQRPATATSAKTNSTGTKPATAQQSGATATASNGKYTVQQGDYPAKIAKKLGISTNALMEANPGINPKRLQIGQVLNVPEKK